MPGTRYCNTENMANYSEMLENRQEYFLILFEKFTICLYSPIGKLIERRKILRENPLNKMKIKKGSIFEFTKGLNFPKENEMFNFQNTQ